MSLVYQAPVVSKCHSCGLEIQDGEQRFRSLDAFDQDPEEYCPSCQSGDVSPVRENTTQVCDRLRLPLPPPL